MSKKGSCEPSGISLADQIALLSEAAPTGISHMVQKNSYLLTELI